MSPESKSPSSEASLWEHTSDWIHAFMKHFEINLLEVSRGLPPEASESDCRLAAIRAMFETILDSGADSEEFAETVGQVLMERRHGPLEWNSDLNERRFELIDRAIFNLVYACRRCNSVKRDQIVKDPFNLLHGENVATLPDGSLHTPDPETWRLILQMDLNSPRMKMWRRMWMRIVDLAETADVDLYDQLVGFPADLPDLSKLRPPDNLRKAGVEESWFARRRRGDLPSIY